MNSGIYTITNIINNKIYVGSSCTLNRRLTIHKRTLRQNKHHNIHLQRAYNKYGKEFFKFELLEYCEESLLPYIEYYWINTLNTLNFEYGYNIAIPGVVNTSNCYKKVDQYDLNGNFIKSWKNIANIEKTLNIDASSIVKICKRKLNHLKGFTFRYKGESLGQIKKYRGKIVNQYTLEGKFIKQWNSTAEVGRNFNCDPSSIARCCTKISNSSFNYIWKYE